MVIISEPLSLHDRMQPSFSDGFPMLVQHIRPVLREMSRPSGSISPDTSVFRGRPSTAPVRMRPLCRGSSGFRRPISRKYLLILVDGYVRRVVHLQYRSMDVIIMAHILAFHLYVLSSRIQAALPRLRSQLSRLQIILLQETDRLLAR